MEEKSNTGLIVVVIVIVVVVLLLVGLCACSFLSMGGCCFSGPAISDVFSGVNSALQATPMP
ncbi:MAG: hypothetical protein KKA73_25630 [Chloroflexi bacterium]|nr:hypothetical protein [Chloroflexota bacterium]MBU1751079.1 hypothetical protein [Chloroflexota bacterium]